MSTADYVVDVVGFAAGVLVASSLLAQIWRAHMLESAVDLSYLWQGTVAVGVLMQLIYLAHYEKWSVFVPLFSELLFMLYLLCLKVYFENHLFGFGRGGRDAEGGAPKLGELLLDGNNGFVPGGGTGPRSEAAGRSSGGGDGGGTSGPAYERLEGGETGRPAAFEAEQSPNMAQ